VKKSGDGGALLVAAGALAERFPCDRFDPAVRAWVESSSPRAVWSVAVSGGPDSVALLLLLWAHWPSRRRQLRVLHFNHRLRGLESRDDMFFCRRLCAKLKIKFIGGSWLGQHGPVSEAAARAVRMAFFAKKARVVWLGHQQDDIAESMLMRLARGSGLGGLSAPRPVQLLKGGRVHLRPLLGIKKGELRAALRAASVDFREDSSNRQPAFFRNRIRHEVIPRWLEAAQRDALVGAARSRELLEEDDAALELWLDALKPIDALGSLDLSRLAGKPRALFRRALHRWLLAEPRAGAISRQSFDFLLAALIRGEPTRHSLGLAGFAKIDQATLRFEPITKSRATFRGPIN